MEADTEYKITIYHSPVYFYASVKGIERYRKEMEFLANIVGDPFDPGQIVVRVPDPSKDGFMLNDEQLSAYSTFRKQLDSQP